MKIQKTCVHHFANSNAKENSRPGDNALEILHERYVRGEIDEEEYNRKKADCESYKIRNE